MAVRAAPRLGHAVALHPEPERFQDAAHGELLAAPPWMHGVCFNPGCGAAFDPGRHWQIYCGAACQAAGNREMRKWGHKAALPLLLWRMGRYEKQDAGVVDLTRAARRYIGQVQSAWLADRTFRMEGATG
ncbi:MAG: hypothetical protein ACPG61_17875 [Paracoccaceae bacterium]